MSEPSAWQQANEAAIRQRLQPVVAAKDGTLCAEPAGVHFVTVTKRGRELRLWLIEQVRPSTGVIQSELHLDDPLRLADAYTQAAMLGLLWQPTPRRAYVAGFGAGRVPMVLHHHFPALHIQCTDIDPTVVAMAAKYFGVQPDARLQVAIADGRAWLAQQPPAQRFDFLYVDAFLDNGYVPYRLSTLEFFTLCRARLTPDGVLVVNLLYDDPYMADRLATVAAAFDSVTVCPLGEDNDVLFATASPPVDKELLIQRAKEVQAAQHFRFPFVQHALALQPAAEVLPRRPATVLRDDAPPAGYFDALPAFDTAFSTVAPELPCPCGSGLAFSACHGAQ